MLDAKAYLDELVDRLRAQFGDRLVYVGLQGSYMRGDATEHSDIDPMVVLRDVCAADLRAYRAIVEALPSPELACGFLCGAQELAQWNALEACQLLHTTRDVYGELAPLLPVYTRADVSAYVKLSAGNLYHEAVHRYVHGTPERLRAALPGMAKSAFFLLQNAAYLETGVFAADRRALLPLLSAQDARLLMLNESESLGDALDAVLTGCRSLMARMEGKGMEIRKNAAAPELAQLLGGDASLFLVMDTSLRDVCDTIVTDGERLIMALSARPSPVWVFMPDDATDAELDRCWAAMRAHFPPELGDSFNMKAAHAAALRQRAQEAGLTLRTTRRLHAHTCPAVCPPHNRPGGSMHAAKPEDLDVAAAFVLAMHRDTREGDQTPEGCRAIAQQRIEQTRLFLWKDETGTPCAMCGVRPDGKRTGLALVYTPPEKRRQGYAASLVHDVTQAILAQHRLPVIYTDADYPPSNACYAQIGYMRCGSLVTVRWEESLPE